MERKNSAMTVSEEWKTFEGDYVKVVTEIVKVRVIKAFNDKTEEFITRPVNETFECTEERAKQLISGGFVEPVPDKSKKTKSTD